MSRPKPPAEFDENPVWTEDMHARARPAAEVHGPEFAAAMVRRRGRPALAEAERKQSINLRLSPDVLAALRAGGRGWQTRAEQILRRGLGLAGRDSTPPPRSSRRS